MVEIIILIGLFLVLVLLGVPISYSLGVAAFATAAYVGLGPVILVQRMASSMQSFVLITIPLFILAGAIMAKGGVAKRIVNFAYILVGPLPGGLAMVNVVQAMFFGGVTGSCVADIASIGPMIIPMMEKKGYPKPFSAALTASAAVVGVVIPPSHNIIIFAMVVGGVSIGQLFLAGYLPGILLCVLLCITCYILAVINKWPREKIPPFMQSIRIIIDGVMSILAAVIVIGGIAFGIFTATEAAAIAVVYALFLSFGIYREMNIKDLWPILKSVVNTSAMIMLLIGMATAFGWDMTFLRIPVKITQFFLSVTKNPILIFLMINILLLILGCLMDMAPLILICSPVLLPVCKAFGMSPLTFCIMMMINLGIGLTTPPVGSALFTVCGITNQKMEDVSKALLLTWPALLVCLFITTYVPQLTTWLPSLMK